MEFLRITGPKEDIDRVNAKYLNQYAIHLENAMSELSGVPDIKPYAEVNPNKDHLIKAENLAAMIGEKVADYENSRDIIEAIRTIENAYDMVQESIRERDRLDSSLGHLAKLRDEIKPFRNLDYNLSEILKFNFIKFRFGRIAHEYYQKFARYGDEKLNTIFYQCEKDDVYVWGIYFVPQNEAMGVDAIFSSLHFERLYIADEYEGSPEEAYDDLMNKIREVEKNIDSVEAKANRKLNAIRDEVMESYFVLKRYSENFEIRKMAACTREHAGGSTFYILCGWMSQKDSIKLMKEIENDPNVFCMQESGQNELDITPPTNLRNPKIIKPFELFVRMYGLPAYTEMDPTLFIALTYTLIFGIMFGDVGQGAVLAIGGFLMYKIKKAAIAGVVAIAGLWSVFFGFMYGSLFGDEHILSAVWMRPMENIMDTLLLSIGFGVLLILISMILHIINAIKEKDMQALLFDPSGISGLLCYGTAVVAVLLVYFGHPMPGVILLGILIGLPLLAIIFKEPLGRILKKKKALEEGTGFGMFIIEALVEGFDVVLSYATNTISFVRVGAFALSHAGMMGVVFSLAEAESGNPNILVLIIGNLVVMGLEGLVVGIQVLRLEYYEMFSRFYKGSGKEFKPFQQEKNN
jgi:V/A-type H+-transporting ATPase subunit I